MESQFLIVTDGLELPQVFTHEPQSAAATRLSQR